MVPYGAVTVGGDKPTYMWQDPSRCTVGVACPGWRLADGTALQPVLDDNDQEDGSGSLTAGSAVCVYDPAVAWFRFSRRKVLTAPYEAPPSSIADVARTLAVAAANLTLEELRRTLRPDAALCPDLLARAHAERSRMMSALSRALAVPSSRLTEVMDDTHLLPARLAVIVPYRPQPCQHRHLHLRDFVEHMCNHFLPALRVKTHKVFVVEQSADGRLFNRGALLNAGARMAIAEGYDVLALHDVDLLPGPCLRAAYESVCGAVGGWTCAHPGSAWKRYTYSTYVGGVFIMHARVYESMNGFPNGFWGWGGEDDCFGERLSAVGVTPADVFRPRGLPDDAFTDLEERYPGTRSSTTSELKNMRKWELRAADRDGWRRDGVNTVAFTAVSTRGMHDAVVTVVRLE